MDRVASGPPLNGKDNCLLAIVPTGAFIVLDTLNYVGDITKPYGSTVSVGNGQLTISGDINELACRLQNQSLISVYRAGGKIQVCPRNCSLHFVYTNRARSQRGRVDANSDGELLGADN